MYLHENLETRNERINFSQLMFLLLRGVGHLTTMIGVVYMTASLIYLAVGMSSWVHFVVGFLIIALGHQLQQLGDKLDVRLTINARHLTIEIKQHFARVLAIAMVVTTFLAI
ncbi:hypothetical protein JSQ81_14950 [Sporosarcina sp. Marseille-Q4063]|uniref:hypothetical protein n=1 Tax=Sporosarcina sp. Marseille-Q4063 TaxID=2810514 RepID=UPI001BB0ABAC|nr:hypothetical protein [Sporosarcina sp. Marseille-Q4063]QUW21098.1 hypothetical protein JSQ81_14950 [Sporosarcina sp. Marseille-Q4063]